MKEVVILSGARTPMGSFNGSLSAVPATQLGAIAIKEAVKRANLDPALIDEVYMGMVLPASVGQAPARQAAIFAGLPNTVTCTTVNKVCGSGMKTVMLAAAQIALGEIDFAVAGGMENMSMVPHALPGSRLGHKMGDFSMVDLMVKDGLWDVYNNFHMGIAAEMCAEKYNLTREMQDEFAVNSYKKAIKAIEDGKFKDEIVPVEVKTRKGVTVVDTDEEPSRVRFDKISTLRPAFKKDGTVTAANASSINDGASAIILASKEKAEELGLPVLATLTDWTSYAHEPEWFTTAPTHAIKKVLKKADLTPNDIDLYEINEAFSVVSLVTNQLAELPSERVDVNGGAVALGHPIGNSGTRILISLLYEMKKQDAKTGLASLCIGGGEATAVIVKR